MCNVTDVLIQTVTFNTLHPIYFDPKFDHKESLNMNLVVIDIVIDYNGSS